MSRFWPVLSLGFAVLIAGSGCAALLHRFGDAPGPQLYVVNALNQTVTAVDPRTSAILKTIDLKSQSPHAIAYLPKRDRVYVLNTGFQQVSVVDPKTQSWVKNILTSPRDPERHKDVPNDRPCMACHTYPVGAMPVNFIPSEDERYLYVANLRAKNVAVIDTEREERVELIPTGEEILGLAVIGQELWVSNRKQQSVSVIDMGTKQIFKTMPAGKKPGFVRARPSASEVYVCMPHEAKILVFDAMSKAIKHEIPTQLGTRALIFNEAKGLGYAANYYTDTVTLFELATGHVLKNETFKLNPDDVVLSADSSELYVSCTGTGELAVADPLTLKERRRFKAGPYSANMALVP